MILQTFFFFIKCIKSRWGGSHIKELEIYKFSNTFVIEKLTHVNRKVNSQDEKSNIKANITDNESKQFKPYTFDKLQKIKYVSIK